MVALGGSLEVVKIMVKACPQALEERLSGMRTILHYAIAEGVGVEVCLLRDGRSTFLLHFYFCFLL